MKKFLNERIDKAIRFAVKAHKNQVRKTEPDMPYICHPISVGFILYNADFAEDVVIAGILHDTIEDTETTGVDIEKAFGKNVRDSVETVSEDKALPYDDRKRKYLEGVLAGGIGTKAISIADSLHNMNSLIDSMSAHGDKIWESFTKNKSSTVEQYYKKVRAVGEIWSHPLVHEAIEKAEELVKKTR